MLVEPSRTSPTGWSLGFSSGVSKEIGQNLDNGSKNIENPKKEGVRPTEEALGHLLDNEAVRGEGEEGRGSMTITAELLEFLHQIKKLRSKSRSDEGQEGQSQV